MEKTDLVHLIKKRTEERNEQLLIFCRDLLRIKSYTFEEETAVKRVIEEMEKLNYDNAYIDEFGNAIGVIGNGPDVDVYKRQALGCRRTDAVSRRPPPGPQKAAKTDNPEPVPGPKSSPGQTSAHTCLLYTSRCV